MFISYEFGRATISSRRTPGASCTDIAGIAEAMSQDSDEALCCIADQSALDALQDGQVWQWSSVNQEDLEELHSMITEAMDK